MAVAYDASVTANGNGVNAITTTALSTAGGNRALLCFVHVSNDTPSDVTFTNDGDDLSWTALSGSPINIPGANNGKVFGYYTLAATQLSSVQFTLTFTGGGNPQSSAIIAAYSGINTSDFIGDVDTGSANFAQTVSATNVTTADNSLVVAGTGQTQNDAMAPGSGEHENAEIASAGGFSRTNQTEQDSATATSGTSVTMDVTVAGFRLMGMFAVELLAAAGGGYKPKTLMMMGI